MIRGWDLFALVLVGLSVYIVFPLADAIVMGLVTAYMLRELVKLSERFVDRRLAESVLLGLFFLLVSGGVYLVVSNVSQVGLEILNLTSSLSSALTSFIEPYDLPAVSAMVSNALAGAGQFMRLKLFEVVTSLPVLLLELLTYFLVTFYVYRDGDRIGESLDGLIEKLPATEASTLREVKESVAKLLRDVFVVYGLYGIILGILGGVGFYVIGLLVRGEPVAFAWAWGIIIGLAAFVEGLSTAIFTAPLILFYFVSGQFWMAFWIVLYEVVVLFALPETFLLPYLGARRMNESFFVILLGFVTGPLVFGIKGIILGPVFIITLRRLVAMSLSPGE